MKSLPLLLLSLVPAVLVTVAPAQYFLPTPGTRPGDGIELLAYDAGRDRTVGLARNATWEHDGMAWRQVTTAQLPRERYEHAMVYDGQRVLVHGGGTPIGQSPPALDDFWAFDGSNWTPLSTTNGPGRRRAHAMAYDPIRQRVVLFGGTDMAGNFFSDTWEWDGATWTQVHVGGPSPRVWHRMVYDPQRARVVLVGGALNPYIYDDTWEWDGSNWIQSAVGGFPHRIMPALVHDAALRRTLMIGGYDPVNAGANNDVYVYDPATTTWSRLPVTRSAQLEQVIGGAFDTIRARTVLVTWDAFAPITGFYFHGSGTSAATYTPYGQGCAGGLGQTPVLAAAGGTTPTPGSVFTAQVSNVGNAASVLFGTGLSNSAWQGFALPLPLAQLGMPGCSVLAALDVLQILPVDARARAASWTWRVPNLRSLLGLTFYQQAITLDATASNGIGGLSNAAAGLVQ